MATSAERRKAVIVPVKLVDGRRTSISLHPYIYEFLIAFTGGGSEARKWLRDRASTLYEFNSDDALAAILNHIVADKVLAKWKLLNEQH